MDKKKVKILIVDDDAVTREVISELLSNVGYISQTVNDGEEAWEFLNQNKLFSIIILDWIMPRLSGIDLLKRIKRSDISTSLYIILLTAKNDINSRVKALNLGADDYIAKPFNENELIARVSAGERIVSQQKTLSMEIQNLTFKVNQIKSLSGILPVCSYCYKVRTKKNVWKNLEVYLKEKYKVNTSHSICPECLCEHYPSMEVPNKKK